MNLKPPGAWYSCFKSNVSTTLSWSLIQHLRMVKNLVLQFKHRTRYTHAGLQCMLNSQNLTLTQRPPFGLWRTITQKCCFNLLFFANFSINEHHKLCMHMFICTVEINSHMWVWSVFTGLNNPKVSSQFTVFAVIPPDCRSHDSLSSIRWDGCCLQLFITFRAAAQHHVHTISILHLLICSVFQIPPNASDKNHE